MKKGWKRIGLALVSLELALVLVASASIPTQAAPKKEIVVGMRQAYTGALASSTFPFGTGGYDCFRYQNDYKGGINGIPIKIIWEDEHSEVTKHIMMHKRFKAAGAVLEVCWLFGSEITAPLQQRDKIPLLHNAGATEAGRTEPIHWIFYNVPCLNMDFGAVIGWAKENWTEPRPLRVGMVGINQPMVFASLKGIPEYCERNGVEWVGYEIVPLVGCIDTSTELLRLAGKKPDFVYCILYGSTLVTVVKDAHRLELQQKGIKFCTSLHGLDKVIVGAAGARDAEGWYTTRGVTSAWETEFIGGIKTPRNAEIREGAKRYRGFEAKEVPEFYSGGWVSCLFGIEAIRIALEKVGIENLNGAAVRDGFVSIKDFDTGALPGPASVSEEKPYAIDYCCVYQCQQGEIVAVAPPVSFSLAGEFGLKL